jgi:hypothetical protein
MKALAAAIMLLATVACSKPTTQSAARPVSQPTVQEPKHGYELAKTWSTQQAQGNIRFAGSYFTTAEWGQVAGYEKARSKTLAYEMCVEGAQEEKTTGTVAIGPQSRAKYNCDSLIDTVEKESRKLDKELAQ